jgi:chemotaxis protein CheZ
MTSPTALQQEYGATIEALADALAANDDALFQATLDALMRRRENTLFGELRKLTGDLQTALERFRVDARLIDLAEKEMPNAKHRLDHVLKLTDEAAHRTMDLVEQSVPLAERTAREASSIIGGWRRFRARDIQVEEFKTLVRQMDHFLEVALVDMDTVRNNLAEVMMTQGYQDLSGQIIRGVMKLVGELEVALAELVRLTKGHASEAFVQDDENATRGFGPAVPGIKNGPAVSGQQDVDSLLAGLGM